MKRVILQRKIMRPENIQEKSGGEECGERIIGT